MSIRLSFFAFCFMLLGTGVYAQATAQSNTSTTTTIHAESGATTGDQTGFGPFRFFDIRPSLRIWGVKADALAGFRIAPYDDSAIWMRLGAALRSDHYYRLSNNSIYQADTNPGVPAQNASETSFWAYNMYWGLGFMQGLHFNDQKDRDDLNALFSYRGWWDKNLPTLFGGNATNLLTLSNSPAVDGMVSNSVQLDLLYDGTTTNKASRVKAGLWADASVEYGPPGLSVPDISNYLQYSASGRGYLPLYQNISAEGWNLFSLYLAGNVAFDYIEGLGNDAFSGIPAHVSQRFGGYSYEDGLGGLVRGFSDGYLDGRLKIAGNVELRANLPAMIDKGLVPGILLYADAGFFADPPGLSGTSKFVLGTGIGIYGSVFDLGSGAIYTNFLLNQTDHANQHWVPVTFEFGMHF